MSTNEIKNNNESIINENDNINKNIDELNNMTNIEAEQQKEIEDNLQPKTQNEKTSEESNSEQDSENTQEGISLQAEAKDDNLDEKNNIENNEKNIKKEKTKTRKIVDIVTWCFVGLLGLILIAVLFLLMLGYKPAVVTSPSMKPNINPGALIFFKDVPAESIKVGDVITFYSTEKDKQNKNVPFTHRVIEIIPNDDGTLKFRTKGDNNEKADVAIIPESRVLGEVKIVIPWVGVVFFFVKNNLLILIGATISIIIFSYIVKMYLSGKKENKDGDNNDNSENKDKKEEIKTV